MKRERKGGRIQGEEAGLRLGGGALWAERGSAASGMSGVVWITEGAKGTKDAKGAVLGIAGGSIGGGVVE